MSMSTSIIRKGNDINFGLTFTKVDKVNRTVSGFATLDNVDDHGDIVSADGSRKAFARFRGGLREMHQQNAVGTLVSFEDIKKYHPEDDKVYDGIYVHAKVSKGAPDTWEKVLDGTYKGFSIGGKVNRKYITVDDDGIEHLVIDDYDLIELSLVDNPANPLANVTTVRKIGDSYVYSDDMVMEKQRLNILLNEESGDVILSEEEDRDGFVNIGWTDSPDNTDKIKYALFEHENEQADKSADSMSSEGWSLQKDGSAEFTDDSVLLEKDNSDNLNTNDEGGATVSTENDKVEETEEEVTKTVDSEEEESTTDESVVEEVSDDSDKDDSVDKAADVSEVESDDGEEETVDKSVDVDEIVSKVQDAVEGALAKATDAADASKTAAEDVKSSFDKAVDEFNEKVSELSKTLDGLAERVEAVEGDTAVKKSADIVDDDEEVDEDDGEDNIWRGSFLTSDSLVKG